MTWLQRRGGRLAIAAAVCIGLMAPGSSALATPANWVGNGWKTTPEAWGVNDVSLSWGDMGDALLEKRVAAIKKLNAKWVRFGISWEQIQAGGPDSYNFAATDRMVARLALHDVRWRPLLLDPPSWAKADPTFPYRQPAKSSMAIAKFLFVFMTRYGPGGTLWTENRGWLPAVPVHDVELHNEPNTAWYWGADPLTWNFRTDYTGEAWAKLYGEALDLIKPMLPATRFWMGGLVHQPSSPGVSSVTFIRNAFTSHPSLRNNLYGVALHAYPYSGDPAIPSNPYMTYTAVPQAIAAMRTYGRPDMMVQLNEIGASMVKVPNEQNRIDIMNAIADMARSNCPIFGFAPYTNIDWETPDHTEHFYGLVSPSTGELYSHGAGWAAKAAAFNAGTAQGTQLKLC